MQGVNEGGRAIYTLADFGSFHVGGRMVEVSGQPRKAIAFTPDMTYEHDPNGRFLVEQIYVQYFVPAERCFETPLTLLHGGGLTGVTWENTPDGRPGWLHEFLRQGFAVNVIDNVERGRSGFCAIDGVWEGEPVTRTAREAWDLFRFGSPNNFDAGKPHLGQRFPVGSMENFQRQFVPRWTTTSAAQFRGIGEALRRIGPSTLICHSQGGFLGSRAAVENPDMIRGVVGCEGAGWVEAVTPATVGDKPWLLLLGDYIEMSERWTKAKLDTLAFAGRVNAVGGTASVVELPKVGFPGSSHMFMMDGHSAEIAAWVGNWIRENC
ncbi:MAG: hypothetical protein CMM47_08970 [Rhodospirillaceae bacterium]|nr:hypothetical protein [Rhodospirillaceae bacterium]